MANIIHEMCKNPALSNIIRYTVEAGMFSVRSNISRELGDTKDKKVIDLACGTGEFSSLCKGTYVGVDLEKEHIMYADRKYGTKSRKFVVRDATKTGFSDKSFDIALMLSVLHHLDDTQVIGIAREAKRLAKEKIIILDLIPAKYNPISKYLYRMDQGHNIRQFSQQESLIKKELKISRKASFRSGFYIHSFMVCDLK